MLAAPNVPVRESCGPAFDQLNWSLRRLASADSDITPGSVRRITWTVP